MTSPEPAEGRVQRLVVPAFVVAVGALLGAGSLDDNSFFTHLATGRLIVGGDGFPHHDPYTFTAAGDPWVVQSWLASVVYGLTERWFDLGGIRLLNMALAGTLSLLAWMLTRPAQAPLARLLAWAPCVLVGASQWNERPLLFGLVTMGLLLLATEERLDPRWLLLVGWGWLNVHGSWPLGLVALAVIALGRRLDRVPVTAVRRSAVFFGAGLLLGSVNPYGPRLLVFPFELLSKRESLQLVVEWRPPRFDNVGELAFLGVLVLGMLAVRRSSLWSTTLPLAAFGVFALLGARNLGVAAIVTLPGVARGLRGLGGLPSSFGRRETRIVGVAAVAMGAVAGVMFVSEPDADLSGYPEDATDWLIEHGLSPAGSRVITQDLVGNYFEARFGADATVFIDDRIEVIPRSVIDDYLELLRGDEGWRDALESYEPDAVLWARSLPLAQLLRIEDGWELAFEDDNYAVFMPTG